MRASKITVTSVAPVAPVVSALGQQVKAMIGEPIPADPVLTVSKDEGKLISTLSGLKQNSGNKNKELCDLLYSNGKRSHHFVGKLEKDPQLAGFRNTVCEFIIEGLEDDSKKLIRSNTESLTETQNAVRQVLIEDNVDNTYSNIKKAMKTLERAKASGATSKKKAASQMVMALREVLSAMDRMSKEKTNPYANIVDDIKVLKALNIHKYVKDTE